MSTTSQTNASAARASSIRKSNAPGRTKTLDRVSSELERIRESSKMFYLLAETFQALGDSSRIQIVWALSHGDLTVGELAELLHMSQPAVSHHLRTLRNLGLVRFNREGRTSKYFLDDKHIESLLREGIEHVEDLM